MTKEEFSKLKEGHIVRGKLSGLAYIVTGNYGDHVTAVRTVELTRPSEWELVAKEAFMSVVPPRSPGAVSET